MEPSVTLKLRSRRPVLIDTIEVPAASANMSDEHVDAVEDDPAPATVRDDAIPRVLTPTMMEQTLHRLAASLRGADRAAKNRPHHALFPPIEKLFSIQITHSKRTRGVPR
jgi:hypothetical protein